MTISRIGFIGTGVMGKSMARHIMNGGYQLMVYNRTKQKALELVAKGAKWCNTVTELTAAADLIITIVGYPADVEELYFGPDGIIANARLGIYLVDMTTSTPALAQKIAIEAEAKGLHALDAPVSGGDVGAREAKLTIMVGGREEAFYTLKPIFSLMGQNISLQGPPGSGQYAKLANQIIIANTMVGIAEAMAYAKKVGLNQEKVLKAIETGAAGSFSLSQLAPRMIKGDFAPGFYVKHFIKDMNIAIKSAEELSLKTPGLSQALGLYREIASRGEENSGTQALYKLYCD